MPLESATYIDQLVASNPATGDAVSQGANHLRLIKSVLQSQFPNFTAAALNSTQTQIDAVVAAYNVNLGQFLPPGTIVHYCGSAAPTGWLLCDGSSYSTSTYANLFGAIQYSYGGSGSSFSVPDARGRVLAMNDSATGRLTGGLGMGTAPGIGVAGGEATHTLVTAELAAHNHGVTDPGHSHTATVTDPGHNHAITDPGHTHADPGGGAFAIDNGTDTIAGGLFFAGSGANMRITSNTTSNTTGISVNSHTTGVTVGNSSNTTGITINNNGSGTAHNNVQPTLVVGTIIKT